MQQGNLSLIVQMRPSVILWLHTGNIICISVTDTMVSLQHHCRGLINQFYACLFLLKVFQLRKVLIRLIAACSQFPIWPVSLDGARPLPLKPKGVWPQQHRACYQSALILTTYVAHFLSHVFLQGRKLCPIHCIQFSLPPLSILVAVMLKCSTSEQSPYLMDTHDIHCEGLPKNGAQDRQKVVAPWWHPFLHMIIRFGT